MARINLDARKKRLPEAPRWERSTGAPRCIRASPCLGPSPGPALSWQVKPVATTAQHTPVFPQHALSHITSVLPRTGPHGALKLSFYPQETQARKGHETGPRSPYPKLKHFPLLPRSLPSIRFPNAGPRRKKESWVKRFFSPPGPDF